MSRRAADGAPDGHVAGRRRISARDVVIASPTARTSTATRGPSGPVVVTIHKWADKADEIFPGAVESPPVWQLQVVHEGRPSVTFGFVGSVRTYLPEDGMESLEDLERRKQLRIVIAGGDGQDPDGVGIKPWRVAVYLGVVDSSQCPELLGCIVRTHYQQAGIWRSTCTSTTHRNRICHAAWRQYSRTVGDCSSWAYPPLIHLMRCHHAAVGILSLPWRKKRTVNATPLCFRETPGSIDPCSTRRPFRAAMWEKREGIENMSGCCGIIWTMRKRIRGFVICWERKYYKDTQCSLVDQTNIANDQFVAWVRTLPSVHCR